MKEDIIQSNMINVKCYARVVTVLMSRRVIGLQGSHELELFPPWTCTICKCT